jgi:hypothetical protein
MTIGGDHRPNFRALSDLSLVSDSSCFSILLWAMISYDHTIVGASKGGLNQTTFCPTIYLELQCTLSSKSWFQLRFTHEKLIPVHVLTPQCDKTVDLMILTVLLNGRFKSVLSRCVDQIQPS